LLRRMRQEVGSRTGFMRAICTSLWVLPIRPNRFPFASRSTALFLGLITAWMSMPKDGAAFRKPGCINSCGNHVRSPTGPLKLSSSMPAAGPLPLRSDRATGGLQTILYLKSAAFVTGEILTSTAVRAPATDVAIRLTRKPNKPGVPSLTAAAIAALAMENNHVLKVVSAHPAPCSVET
jgi:hypothetical protein